MKKNIIKLVMSTLLFSSFFMLSCDENDLDYDVSHSYVTTSFGNTANVVQVNGTISFIDLSRGLNSRTWTFPENTVDTGYVAIATSNLPAIKVRFTTPGMAAVQLTQVFKDSVWANGKKQAVQYDSIINVKVLDSVRARFTAERALDLSPLTLPTLNEVIAGRVVNFASTSTGEPTTIKWTITRQDGVKTELTGANVSNKFSVPGTYSITMYAKNAFGANTQTTSSYIKIVPSTDPVTLDEVNRDSEDVIGLVFSRSMQAPSASNIAALTVTITNGGATVPVTIQSVSTVENIVKLKLSTKIYSSDVIKVSYDDTKGSLITEDAVTAKSFTNVQLMNFKVANLLVGTAYDYSFETTDANWPYLWWGTPWDMYTATIKTTKFHSGLSSMYMEMKALGGAIIGNKTGTAFNTFTLEAGKKYSIGVWLYVVDLGNNDPAEILVPNVRFYWQTGTDWSVGGVDMDNNFPKNIWVYRSVTVTAPAAGGANSMTIRGYNSKNPSAFKFYMDDISLTKIEDRP